MQTKLLVLLLIIGFAFAQRPGPRISTEAPTTTEKPDDNGDNGDGRRLAGAPDVFALDAVQDFKVCVSTHTHTQ
jgi:hypothetical protein